MIIYNNQEFKSFNELREKCHLISEYYIRLNCHCRTSVTEKICKENNVEKYPIIANVKKCFVFNESIIDLIKTIKPQGSETIPSNYITRKELAKYLNVSLGTLSDIEFWCWDFENYKKTLTVKGASILCYEFTPEAKDFYDHKIYKWRNPDRKHGTCWQK